MTGPTDQVAEIRSLLLDWLTQRGHDSCHYYPEIFAKICKLVGIEYTIPCKPDMSRADFHVGCIKFQDEIFGEEQ